MVCPVSDTVVIDVGNTAIKVARFDSHEIISVERFEISQTDLPPFFARFLNSNNQFVIAASGTQIDVDNLLPRENVFEINHTTALPITVDYETPETVGLDRLANAVMSTVRFPNQAVLVVDLGSCITFDLTVGCVFRGGAISPGLAMRTRAMHTFTARLPQVAVPDSIPLIGKSTVGALQSGALNGWLSEIKGMTAAFATLNPDLQFVYTGGDISYFEQAVKSLIFADPNWTLKGYYEIYRFNAH
jgi:type III pantothenate kinase